MSVEDTSQDANLCNQGLKPVQVWVPDTQSPTFREDLHMQIARLDPADEQDALEYIGGVVEFPDAGKSA